MPDKVEFIYHYLRVGQAHLDSLNNFTIEIDTSPNVRSDSYIVYPLWL